ncbi:MULTISPECIES: hypothetical protein [unclassified Wolbachia]|uniref:hypothetical protein n=1 Tax=unclassified Wolbachia TaxID=2640676 RepID=UPI0007EEC5D8|nr:MULTISPECIES: hypothetical protein [unclassified Wolbachia]
MLETLKKWGTDLTLKVKDLFTSPESQVYVKDLRKVMVYKDGRKCRYPKNYDEIVRSGKIIEEKDSSGKLVKDEEGNPRYQLEYNGYKFNLDLVRKIDKKSYFTIDFLVDKARREVNDYSKFYKPFKFSKIDLEKHVPIFEAQKPKDPQYPFELTNSSVLIKKVKNKEGKVQEVVDEKGRNGKLLYTSDYKKLSTHFSEIRDQNGNLELDKSLISVPIVFATSLAKVCTKLLTSLPIKLGKHLISKQNPIAKSFGYLLFTPAMAIKNLVNMGATILKAPILLFVANKKKYGDAYLTMLECQLKECWKEAENDFKVVKDGKREAKQKENRPDLDPIIGTWKELNARRPDIEKDLKKQENDKGISKSNEILKSPEEEQNKGNEILSGKSKGHVEKLQNRRNSQQGQGATHTHSP